MAKCNFKVLFFGIFLVLLLGADKLLAQALTDRTFTTDFIVYKNNIFTDVEPQLFLDSDSIVNLSFNKADTSNSYRGERWHYRLDNQLQIVDSFRVWQRQTTYRPLFMVDRRFEIRTIRNHANDSLFHFEVLFQNDSIADINLYSTHSDLRKKRQVFSVRRLVQGTVIPVLYDSSLTLIIGSSRGTPNNQPASIHTYSLNSASLIKEDLNFLQNTNLNFHGFYIHQVIKSTLNPQNPSECYLFQNGASTLVKIDWVNQRFLGLLDSINNQVDDSLVRRFSIFSHNYYDFSIDNDKITFLGNHQKYIPGSQTNYSYQIAEHTVNQNDSLIHVAEYGNPAPANDISGFKLLNSNGQKYILGWADRKWSYFTGDSIEMTLFVTDSAKTDSLYFYGDKGHRPMDIKVNSQGDVFIASMYMGLAFEVSVQLTKIPANLINSIQEQKLASKLYLYPNPTHGVLKSNEFSNAEVLRIFNINGALIQEIRNPQSNAISVEYLDHGTYLIQSFKAGKSKSGIFIKQ